MLAAGVGQVINILSSFDVVQKFYRGREKQASNLILVTVTRPGVGRMLKTRGGARSGSWLYSTVVTRLASWEVSRQWTRKKERHTR